MHNNRSAINDGQIRVYQILYSTTPMVAIFVLGCSLNDDLSKMLNFFKILVGTVVLVRVGHIGELAEMLHYITIFYSTPWHSAGSLDYLITHKVCDLR